MVTVVGAGPVGLTLAALLGRRGWRVRVVERRASASRLPRAVHLDDQAARILDAAGVMADLAPRTEPMDAYEWQAADGRVLLRLQTDTPLGRSGWPASSMFAQPDLEDLLERRLDQLATVRVERGRRVDTLDELGEGWVVACDGARSTVRSLLGVEMEDDGFHFDWLIVDVVLDAERRWVPLNVQICDPARPTTAVSGGPGRRRWEFMCLPGEDVATLDTEESAWKLLAPWDLHAGNATLERHAVYRFEARLAKTWRVGKVLLAGDAAHQMPPFAGQGLCAGLRDAANLAWKLDLVLSGRAGQHILDSYGSERLAQVRVEIDFSVDLGRIICVLDPVEAATRDQEMSAAAALSGPIAPPPPPPLGPGVLLEGDPHAGHLGVQGTWPGDDGARFDDVVGRGWVLYERSGDPAGVDGDGAGGSHDRMVGAPDATLPVWWAQLDGRSVDISQGPELYQQWFCELDADAVLVRPDFVVFGTARGPDAAASLIAALRRSLVG